MDGYTYEMYESELERIKRVMKRREIEEEMVDCGLPFVMVPNDYGTHEKLYPRGEIDE